MNKNKTLSGPLKPVSTVEIPILQEFGLRYSCVDTNKTEEEKVAIASSNRLKEETIDSEDDILIVLDDINDISKQTIEKYLSRTKEKIN